MLIFQIRQTHVLQRAVHPCSDSEGTPVGWRIDHTLVPGVLFCNRPLDVPSPSLIDIAPTILKMFGIDTPKYMDGKAIHVPDADGVAEKTEDKEPTEKA